MATPLDVLCVGEALVDFLPEQAGKAVHEVSRWTRCTGGSLANVAVGLSRLNARSGLVSVVGEDEFGTFLCQSLAQEGVDISHVRRTQEGKTGLVFISLSETGERTFAFYRTMSAELFLDDRDLDRSLIGSTRVLHCGTNSLLYRDAQNAVLSMVKQAAGLGKIVSCDPNVRLHLWQEPRELKALLQEILPYCTVVKLSEEELEFVTGQRQPEEALAALQRMGVLLPIVTLGDKGAVVLYQERLVRVSSPKVSVVDTTGAGDGFMAGFLFGLTRIFADRGELERAGVGEIRELAAFGCAVGARVVTQLGAVKGLPRLREVEDQLPKLLRTQ